MPSNPRPMMPIPPNRTYEGVLHHFNVERAIADRLKAADRHARKEIYGKMYDELFAQVPDHPRLTRRADAAATKRMNQLKLALARPFLKPDGSFLEFGPGDCRFSFEMTRHARQVYAIDIADQIGLGVKRPDNFELIVYNGYDVALEDGSIDTAFSDQLIEHLHPQDTANHFRLVHRLLKSGGVYMLRTPHRLTGPHDVSRYFSRNAVCFHLKEWTYGELVTQLRTIGFTRVESYWFGRGRLIKVPTAVFRSIEAFMQFAPLAWRRGGLRYLMPGVSVAAYK
ncbi:bifunctional 2-polyprenyl-6-hydroxyphenol methylase/3-demethylubiquinol 3-O-methyltransferase UbiG [Pelagibius sp.]|uniref:class I SAM-dependent methyltransferase n=1 Tax=Pelagibius sp. TaxID=1931238 RepID=UPI0026271D82|nr:class I SAM-dependent methyltransferase [Pelagibius sp.]